MKNFTRRKIMKSLGIALALLMYVQVGLSTPNYNLENELAQVTINVTDENGDPLPGVNVQVKGTLTGGTTDGAGSLTLDVGSDAILVVSYIGYKTQEISVGGRSSISVQLAQDVEQLQELGCGG